MLSQREANSLLKVNIVGAERTISFKENIIKKVIRLTCL